MEGGGRRAGQSAKRSYRYVEVSLKSLEQPHEMASTRMALKLPFSSAALQGGEHGILPRWTLNNPNCADQSNAKEDQPEPKSPHNTHTEFAHVYSREARRGKHYDL